MRNLTNQIGSTLVILTTILAWILYDIKLAIIVFFIFLAVKLENQ